MLTSACGGVYVSVTLNECLYAIVTDKSVGETLMPVLAVDNICMVLTMVLNAKLLLHLMN